MKKTFFTLILLAVTTLLSAQSFQFEWEGTVYEDGQTIICPFDMEMGEYVQHMKIRNLTDADLDIVMEQFVIETVPGAIVQLCWGMCMVGDTIVSRPVTVPAQTLSDEELSFHVMFTEGETGVVAVRYVGYNANRVEEAIALNVLAGQGANVSENSISLGQAYPNPASTQVHFDFNGNEHSDVTAVVYNLLGQEVKVQSVNGNRGRINIDVDDLQPGIYFCSIQVNKATVKTEKFIVKH
ncbi:MAG: T9SS type A sorting domain-containing protein [Bacteroidales bacterium]|nr:T9SS type A sorting domain-containing protein [Bacteroidales bacterium]